MYQSARRQAPKLQIPSLKSAIFPTIHAFYARLRHAFPLVF
jgi:hypothetical protein